MVLVTHGTYQYLALQKEVIVENLSSGEFFTGADAKALIGLLLGKLARSRKEESVPARISSTYPKHEVSASHGVGEPHECYVALCRCSFHPRKLVAGTGVSAAAVLWDAASGPAVNSTAGVK